MSRTYTRRFKDQVTNWMLASYETLYVLCAKR